MKNISSKCPICHNTFDIPRTLPCNNNICDYCVLLLTENEHFKCPICNESHQNDNFPVDETIFNLINSESAKKLNELKSILEEIDSKANKINFDLNNGSYIIEEECMELCRLVQLDSETKIQKIQQDNEIMIKEINNFKLERIKYYNQLNKDDFNKDFYKFTQTIDHLNSKIEINPTDESKDDLNELKSRIFIYETNVKSQIFSGISLRYAADNFNILGKLYKHSLDSICFDKKAVLSGWNSSNIDTGKIGIDFLENGDFVVSYVSLTEGDLNEHLKIIIFNPKYQLKNSKIIKEVSDISKMLVTNNTILIKYRSDYFYNDYCITHLDAELNILSKITNFRANLIGFNESFVYFHNSGFENHILIYSHSLKLIKTIGQTMEPSKPFYFPKINYLKCVNDRYYCFDNVNHNLLILNESTGALLRKIGLKNSKFYQINSNNNLILLQSDDFYGELNPRLLYLSFNGDLLKTFDLNNLPLFKSTSPFEWVRFHDFLTFDKQSKIHFFNPIKRSIFFE